MLDLIGYALLANDAVVESFDSLPAQLAIHETVTICCPALGIVYVDDTEDPQNVIMYKLVEKYRDNSAAAAFHSFIKDSAPVFDGEKVTVVGEYSPVPDIVPSSITPLQVRLALNASNLRTQVNAYVASLPQSDQDKWEYATTIERTNPTLVSGTAALGMTVQQVDDLFRLASTLL